MRTRIVAALALGALLGAGATAAPASALLGNPDGLPAGSTACTDWVQSSQGVHVRGYADYNPATFTTRVANTPGGPETIVHTTVTRMVQPEFAGVFVPAPSAGTHYFRSCVQANKGPVYRYSIRFTGTPAGAGDHGPHQATMGPGGTWCGDQVEGPSIGRDDGVARLTGSSSVPVKFAIHGHGAEYGSLGEISRVTGTSVDLVYVPAPDVSNLFVCVTNTSNSFATFEFELTAV